MPAPIVVKEKALRDHRFTTLARLLGICCRANAKEICERIWQYQLDNYTKENPTELLDADTIDDIAEIVGTHQALVKAGLAEVIDSKYRVKGHDGKVGRIHQRRTANPGYPQGPGTSTDPSIDRSTDPSHDHSIDQSGHSYDLPSRSDLSSSPEQIRNGSSRDLRIESAAKKWTDRDGKAADKLRDLVLEEDPRNALKKRPWTDGTLRGKWADAIRLMRERDGRTYEELWDVMDWLFRKQPMHAHRFVVQSPESLREKWDRIQAVRRNNARPTTNAPGRPVGRVEPSKPTDYPDGDIDL
jgi:hypothetical protein